MPDSPATVSGRLATLRRISLWRTLICAARTHGLGFLIYPRTRCRVLTRSLHLRERLELGASWHGTYYPGEAWFHPTATLETTGRFVFHSGMRLSVNEDARLSLGSGYANHGVNLHCFHEITIGHGVFIAEGVHIRDSDNHQIVDGRPMSAPIHIEDHVWIGINAIILKGVTIGEGSVVAAGAVVTRDVPPQTMVAGVPAQFLKAPIIWN